MAAKDKDPQDAQVEDLTALVGRITAELERRVPSTVGVDLLQAQITLSRADAVAIQGSLNGLIAILSRTA